MDGKKFAAEMAPAGGLADPVAGKQSVEPGTAVGVNDPPEVLQMRPGMFAPRLREGRLLRSGEYKNSAAGGREPANGRSSRT